jgi:hypothetical protein
VSGHAVHASAEDSGGARALDVMNGEPARGKSFGIRGGANERSL